MSAVIFAAVFATTTGMGAAWWAEQHMRPGIWRRLTMVIAAPPGALWYVACEDREEADWLCGYMVTSGGVHKGTVKVRRIGHEVTCKRCRERRPYWHHGWCKPCHEAWLTASAPASWRTEPRGRA